MLGIRPDQALYTEAIRPRLWWQKSWNKLWEIEVCHKCQAVTGPHQYPPGVTIKPGGAWGGR